MATAFLENTNRQLYNVHDEKNCGAHCPLHRRTNHHMRSWPQHFRADRGFIERICPHGVGHPDPDDPNADPVHGCDGCCAGDSRSLAEQERWT